MPSLPRTTIRERKTARVYNFDVAGLTVPA
jgi:hypothetical protein